MERKPSSALQMKNAKRDETVAVSEKNHGGCATRANVHTFIPKCRHIAA